MKPKDNLLMIDLGNKIRATQIFTLMKDSENNFQILQIYTLESE